MNIIHIYFKLNGNQSDYMILKKNLVFLDWVVDCGFSIGFQFSGCLLNGVGDLLDCGLNLWCESLSFSFKASLQFLALLNNGTESTISSTLLTIEIISKRCDFGSFFSLWFPFKWFVLINQKMNEIKTAHLLATLQHLRWKILDFWLSIRLRLELLWWRKRHTSLWLYLGHPSSISK